MSKVTVDNIWIEQVDGRDVALRIDWDNDYHLFIRIAPPFGPEEIADALKHMGLLILYRLTEITGGKP
jgi:hypothetical protein